MSKCNSCGNEGYYNSDTGCSRCGCQDCESPNPCEIGCGCDVKLNSLSCATHDGIALDCISVVPGDNLEAIITKINQTICQIGKVLPPFDGIIDEGLFKEVKIPISQADMFALHITDKELLPPHIDFGYDVYSVVLRATPVTTDYFYNAVSGNDDSQMVVKIKGAATPAFGEPFGITGGFVENINTYVAASINIPATKFLAYHINPVWTASSNHGIYLSIDDSDNYYTLGDHTFEAVVTYREVTI